MKSETAPFPDDTTDRRQIAERRVAPCLNPDVPERRISAADRRSAGLHAVARSFGLHPDHLEEVDHDDPMDAGAAEDEAQQAPWEDLSRRCTELEARLAESEEEAARFRSELEELRRKLAGN